MLAQAYLGLGSNVGDRQAALARAIEALGQGPLTLTSRSSIYRTEPLEVVDQEDFLNQVVGLQTGLDPAALLARCLEIEKSLGRVRGRDKGPRILDIDLLLHGDAVLRKEGLEVPHPRLHLRRFVLVPLVEIAPEVRHPVLGLTAREMLQRCPDRSRVDRV
jgi:2-amino-4-hydroxy-6-hydroxymethyldihydropteridine diphosphokinase